jgi:hypothetical protein
MLENAMKERLTASACELNAKVESTTTTYNVNYILISFELFEMTFVLCLQIFHFASILYFQFLYSCFPCIALIIHNHRVRVCVCDDESGGEIQNCSA